MNWGGLITTPCFSFHWSLLTANGSLVTAHYSQLTTHKSLLTAHCSLLTPHSSPLTTHSSPLTTHYPLLTTHHSLPMAYRLLATPLALPAFNAYRYYIHTISASGRLGEVTRRLLVTPPTKLELKHARIAERAVNGVGVHA